MIEYQDENGVVIISNNPEEVISTLADIYGDTMLALADCHNIAKEMKEHKFEDKKTDESVMKNKLGDDPMCDAIRDCVMKYMDDKINHPKHYCEGRKYEPIEVIEDWGLGMHAGNAVKYISRAGRKGDAIEDLEKARWYVDRYIEKRDKFFIRIWDCIRRWFASEITPESWEVSKDWELNDNLKEALHHISICNVWTMKTASELLTKEINNRKEVMNGRI